jgi:hypothetical protein
VWKNAGVVDTVCYLYEYNLEVYNILKISLFKTAVGMSLGVNSAHSR